MTNNTKSQPYLTQHLSVYRSRIEQTLNDLFNTHLPNGKLTDAVRYSSLDAGKRLRPILVYATGSCLGQSIEQLDYAAAAIECIHCYSLIHDDLPAMDDDHLRRGKPTCHIAFDQATAILAGDALQSLAFQCLKTYTNSNLPAAIQMQMVALLSSAATEMVIGQSLDLDAENKQLAPASLEHIHRLKTGALFTTSVLLGALAANCQDPKILSALKVFADNLGLAFQLQDDLLDSTGDSMLLGKNTGQDDRQQKATYTRLFGEENTRIRINELMTQAVTVLQDVPHDTVLLETLCVKLMDRQR